jgi:hypothetical protein
MARSVEKVGFQNAYPLISVESGTGKDASLQSYCRAFSRGQQSPIFSISWLGEGNWSKVIRLQFQAAGHDSRSAGMVAGKPATAPPLSAAHSHGTRHYLAYIFVIVKFPDPEHPDVTPVKVHVPEIVLFFTVPWRVNTLLLGVPD